MLVCPDCFNDNGLKNRLIEIRPKFDNEKCDFHPSKKGIPLEEVAKIIDEVFRNNFEFGNYNSMEDDFNGDGLLDVLYEITGVDEHQIAEALQQQLIDGDDYWPPYGDDSFYRDDMGYVRGYSSFESHSRLWEQFRESISYKQRFFNRDALEILQEIFKNIHLQQTKNKKRPVYFIDPKDNRKIFRARIIEYKNEEIKKILNEPEQHLGPPPSRKRKAGRMNPSGLISLYGAFEIETCISELRPVVGATIASVEFELIEPICVLDTTLFEEPLKEPNIFSKNHVRTLSQWRFMKRFMHEISRPISPTDEHLDYVPTQVVAEYLKHIFRGKLKGAGFSIDAIIYNSAQNKNGKNIVLLGDAATILKDKTKKESDNEFDFHTNLVSPQKSKLKTVPDSVKFARVSSAQYASDRVSQYIYDDPEF